MSEDLSSQEIEAQIRVLRELLDLIQMRISDLEKAKEAKIQAAKSEAERNFVVERIAKNTSSGAVGWLRKQLGEAEKGGWIRDLKIAESEKEAVVSFEITQPDKADAVKRWVEWAKKAAQAPRVGKS
jgi:hypothetical protein